MGPMIFERISQHSTDFSKNLFESPSFAYRLKLSLLDRYNLFRRSDIVGYSWMQTMIAI